MCCWSESLEFRIPLLKGNLFSVITLMDIMHREVEDVFSLEVSVGYHLKCRGRSKSGGKNKSTRKENQEKLSK